MLITLKKEVEEQREVAFPIFLKWGGHYYYFKSATDSIVVSLFDWHTKIDNDTLGVLYLTNALEKGEEITFEDFDFAYQMALERLTKAVKQEPVKA